MPDFNPADFGPDFAIASAVASSVPVLPALKGLTYPVKRFPKWKTMHQEAVSGQDNPISLWSFPRWAYEVSYNVLRSDNVNIEWQALAAFFNQMLGSAGVFQFSDPDDILVVNQIFGAGDGVKTAFPLVRTMTGVGNVTFVEPVFAPTLLVVYRNQDWQGKQVVYQTPRTNVIFGPNNFTLPFGWTATNCTMLFGVAVSPDGTVNAWQYARTAFAASFIGTAAVKPAVALPYSFSIYGRVGSGSFLALSLQDGFGTCRATFNILTGTIATAAHATGTFTNISAQITAMGGGWYRCSVSATVGADTQVAFYYSGASTNIEVDGTDVSNSANIATYGAQGEQTLVPTSYIPTFNTPVTDYTLGTQGMVTFSSAPLNGAVLTWTGAYNWLCRFDDDVAEFENFASKFWDLKKINFTTIKTQSK